MKKFLKNLLRNCWSDFEIISQECSLGDPLQKVFAKFCSLHKHGCGEWGLLALYGNEEILKNLLRNRWSDFEIISQECSLGDPFQKCSQNFDLSIDMALVIGGLFALYGHEEILKKLFSPKLLVRF